MVGVSTVSARTHDATAIIRLPAPLLERVDALCRVLAPPGANPLSRSDVLRSVVLRGVEAAEAAHGKPRRAKAKGRRK